MQGFISFLKKNKLNLTGISIILIITITIGMMFIELNKQMTFFLEDIKSHSNVEDFSFYPNIIAEEIINFDGDYTKALEEKVEFFSEKYHFTYENHIYKVLKENDKIIRIYQPKRKIDTPYIISGSGLVTDDGGAVIDLSYADYHNISVGDVISCNGKDFEIRGIALFPDKLSPIVDNTGLPYNRSNQMILMVSEADFKKIDVNENYEIVGIANENFDIKSFENDNEVYTLTRAKENPQIFKTVESKIMMNTIILSFSLTLLFSIVALLLIMTIVNSINTETAQIGVMKALGCTNWEISCGYFKYFIVILFPCLIGYAIGYLLLPEFSRAMMSDVIFPISSQNINLVIFILLTLCPAIVFSVLAWMVAVCKVKKPALELIRSGGKKRENSIVRNMNKNLKHRTYLKNLRKIIIFAKPFILLFVIFAGFALGVQTQFAFTMYGMTSDITSKVMKGVNYNAMIQFINPVDEKYVDDNDLAFNQQTVHLINSDGESYPLNMCILEEKDSDLLELFDTEENKIFKNNIDGIIINKWMQQHYNLQKDDNVNFLIENNTYTMKVAAISSQIYGTTFYTSTKYAIELGLFTENEYNGVFTTKGIEFDSEKHLSIVSTSEIKESIESSSEIYIFFSLFFLITGVIIGLAMLILSMYTVINSYQKYISLMKIIGYTEKECEKIVKGFRIPSMIGYIVSIPYSYFLCRIMFGLVSTNSDIVYETEFNVVSVIICFLITILTTEFVLSIFLKKVRKVSFRIIMEH